MDFDWLARANYVFDCLAVRLETREIRQLVCWAPIQFKYSRWYIYIIFIFSEILLNFTSFLYTKGFQNCNTNFNLREKFRNLIFDNSGKRYECSLKFRNGNNWKIPFHWFKAVGPCSSCIIYFDISMKHVDVIGRLKISSIFFIAFSSHEFYESVFFFYRVTSDPLSYHISFS